MIRQLLFLLIVFAISCTHHTDSPPDDLSEQNSDPEVAYADYVTPTRLARESERPILSDDLGFKNLALAINRQIAHLSEKNASGTMSLGNKVVPLSRLQETLERFRALLLNYQNCAYRTGFRINCEEIFYQAVDRDFDFYVPNILPLDNPKDFSRPAKFTAYYTPTIAVQTQKNSIYAFPIYARPTGKNAEAFDRKQIDFHGKLSGQSLELFYARDRFDLYNLHIEGGGRVIVKDKEDMEQYLSYDETNKKSWRFISNYMLQKGYIKDLTLRSQHEFLKRNKDRHEEIYATCPSYVYFKKTAHEPEGSDKFPLTDNRSIATDRNYYGFKGLLAFISAERPTEDADEVAPTMRRFSRFMLDQDTGGAIKGKARVDIYFGKDEYAKLAAHTLVSYGQLYFLLLKDHVP